MDNPQAGEVKARTINIVTPGDLDAMNLKHVEGGAGDEEVKP